MLVAVGRDTEVEALAWAMKLHIGNRVFIDDNKTAILEYVSARKATPNKHDPASSYLENSRTAQLTATPTPAKRNCPMPQPPKLTLLTFLPPSTC